MTCNPTPTPEELRQVHVLDIGSIRPSPENDQLYRPVDPDEPANKELTKSVQRNGILEPLVVSLDGFILSGHRRYAAAQRAGLTQVPVRYANLKRSDDIDRFVKLLREHNRQRDKSHGEKLREELLNTNPEQAYRSIIAYREEQARIDTSNGIILRERKRRSIISAAKQPFLQAVEDVVNRLKKYWPVSERSIHYHLLNAPPLRNTKRRLRYKNDEPSYKDLSNICTRARLMGAIPMHAIHDETRPVSVWDVFSDPRYFIQRELDSLFKGYWRDLMIDQPNHVEILVEKNTVVPFLRNVAMQYRIPITSGRGYGSLPPRNAMAERYQRSGKRNLVLIIMSDFDPAGEEIAHSFARSMRDDFGIEDIHAVKAGLTYEQVQSMDLHTDASAKKGDSNYKRFVSKYGTDVYELEAVMPDVLQSMLTDAIDQVIDVQAFNRQLDAEREDSTYLQAVRNIVHRTLRNELDLGD